MIATLLALLVLQVGPDPMAGKTPGLPEEMRDRPAREQPVATDPAPTPQNAKLAECLTLASSDAEQATDYAQHWRETAAGPLELAQSAHCLGLALVTSSDFAAAQKAFETAAAELPDGAPAYKARLTAMSGNAAMAQDQPAIAEMAFGRAIELARSAADAPLEASFAIDRARALVALGRSEDAVAALAAARAADPANARGWLLSATLSRRLDRLGEAQQQIEQAATLDPRDPAIGLEAGVIAALAGREQDARRSFESVLLVAPDSAEAEKAAAYLEQLK